MGVLEACIITGVLYVANLIFLPPEKQMIQLGITYCESHLDHDTQKLSAGCHRRWFNGTRDASDDAFDRTWGNPIEKRGDDHADSRP